MSQHDLSIANQGFPAFRSDLNNALQALGSMQSGTSEPATTYANMLWYDTTNNIVKMRNEDNDAWISLITLNQTNDIVAEFVATSFIPSGSTVPTNGLYLPAANSVGIATNSTNAVYINSSQNVGIGTSSPSYGLDIRKSTGGISWSTDPQWWVKRDSGAEFLVQPTSSLALVGTFSNHSVAITTNNTERMRINSSGNVGIGTSSPNKRLTVYSDDGYIQMLNASTGTGNTDGSFIGVEGGTTALRIVNQENDVISFHTNGLANERMRIDSSGYLLINQTSNVTSSYLQIKGAQPAISCESTSTGSVSQVLFRNPNGQVGSIGTSGTSTSYNTSSDYRLKENIAPMTGALAKVAALNPVTYTWKVDGFAGQGFIAHELQAVVPDCVTGEKDAVDAEGKPEYQGVDTSFLVATLTAAIKEQQAIIEQQSQAIASLTTRIAALEAK
jgi:hypothetical protein